MSWDKTGQEKIRPEHSNYENFEAKWFYCIFCGHPHPEHNIVETDKGKMCIWHYPFYYGGVNKLDEQILDISEEDDEPDSTGLR